VSDPVESLCAVAIGVVLGWLLAVVLRGRVEV
jgi:hypothetical protein